MSGFFTNDGIDNETRQLLGNNLGNLWIVPITDNTPFALADIYSSHTPTSLVGGSPVELLASNWTGSTVAAFSTYTYPPVTWIFDPYVGSTTIYGYMVYRVGAITNDLIWGEMLPTPFAVPNAGGSLTLRLTYNHAQCDDA